MRVTTLERRVLHCCPRVESSKHNLVVERHSSVHMRAFLFIVAGRLHHVLWVTEQSQVHQLVVQTVLLFTQNTSKSPGSNSE